MLRSYLNGYCDAYLVVKKTVTAEGANANNQTDKMLAFKNNAHANNLDNIDNSKTVKSGSFEYKTKMI